MSWLKKQMSIEIADGDKSVNKWRDQMKRVDD